MAARESELPSVAARAAKSAGRWDLYGKLTNPGDRIPVLGAVLTGLGGAYAATHGTPPDKAAVSGAASFAASTATGTMVGGAIGGLPGALIGAGAGTLAGLGAGKAVDAGYEPAKHAIVHDAKSLWHDAKSFGTSVLHGLTNPLPL